MTRFASIRSAIALVSVLSVVAKDADTAPKTFVQIGSALHATDKGSREILYDQLAPFASFLGSQVGVALPPASGKGGLPLVGGTDALGMNITKILNLVASLINGVDGFHTSVETHGGPTNIKGGFYNGIEVLGVGLLGNFNADGVVNPKAVLVSKDVSGILNTTVDLLYVNAYAVVQALESAIPPLIQLIEPTIALIKDIKDIVAEIKKIFSSGKHRVLLEHMEGVLDESHRVLTELPGRRLSAHDFLCNVVPLAEKLTKLLNLFFVDPGVIAAVHDVQGVLSDIKSNSTTTQRIRSALTGLVSFHDQHQKAVAGMLKLASDVIGPIASSCSSTKPGRLLANANKTSQVAGVEHFILQLLDFIELAAKNVLNFVEKSSIIQLVRDLIPPAIDIIKMFFSHTTAGQALIKILEDVSNLLNTVLEEFLKALIAFMPPLETLTKDLLDMLGVLKVLIGEVIETVKDISGK